MAEILWVNGCLRGKQNSRTYQVTKAFLDAYLEQHPEDRVTEVDLQANPPCGWTAEELAHRDALLEKGMLDDPVFAYAKQFAAADKVLLSAPYWDLSFPSAVRAYLERLGVIGVTWRYSPQGLEVGMCRAKKFLYILTSGGSFPEAEMAVRGHGRDYLRALVTSVWGIPRFDTLWVQGLDVIGNDAAAILADGMEKARTLAKSW